jgi:DNA-binding NarL/FixJ family response regulator
VSSIRPHVLLTELELNPGSGLRLTRRVRESTRVVVLTRHEVGDVLLDAVSAGAVGCLGHRDGVDETKRLVLESSPTQFTIAPGRLLGALRGAATRATAGGPDSPLLRLTPREREVLALLAAGRDNHAIAATLYVSPETARTHVRNLLRKLGVHSRADAALLALRSGLGQPDESVIRIEGPDLSAR